MNRTLKTFAAALVVAVLVVFATPARGKAGFDPTLQRPRLPYQDIVHQMMGPRAEDLWGREAAQTPRRLTENAPRLQVAGEIVNVDIVNSTLVMQFESGAYWSFPVSVDCMIFINNEEAQLVDLMPGERAVVVFEVRGFLDFVAREIHCTR